MNNGEATDATRRLATKKQTPDVAYAPPENYLEIDVINPITHGIGNQRYTDYEVRMKVSPQISLFSTRDFLMYKFQPSIKFALFFQTNLPVFRVKESSVRRRYSDFEWLRNELERDSKIVVPPLPSKAIKRQLPFRADDGIYEEEFIENRRSGLEQFINK